MNDSFISVIHNNVLAYMSLIIYYVTISNCWFMLSFVKTLCISHLHVLCIVVQYIVCIFIESLVICNKCDYDFIYSSTISSVVTVVIIICIIICDH